MKDEEQKIETLEDCIDYFRSGETREADWVVGTEHEKIGVYRESGLRIPYEGEHGIGALLHRIAERDAWTPILEGGNVIALKKEGASITLEPGGQIELSGAPLATTRETCREFNTHVDLLIEESKDFGVSWLALGVDPVHPVDQIPTMPKKRYDIMRNYLPTRGGLAMEMMHASATVQANFDFSDEADMAHKLRTAMGCTAIVSAIFANSSISAGEQNGFASKRVAIWRDTDPDRCGLLHFVFEEGFGYREYAEWALDVPMFLLVRDGEYIPARGLPFRRFIEEGLGPHAARLGDWDLHLTTLFPEVRLKRIIEVRGADAVPRELTCALPALWKGILYDADACQAAWGLVEKLSAAEREEAQLAVARGGLAAMIGGRPVLEMAKELVAIAEEALGAIGERGQAENDERHFLEPIWAQLELGKSPGEILAERWESDWGRDPRRMIEDCAY
ncbi:MAG: glutamate--cysteine ligase [Myxococcota bacterium]|nr:glutamate--cysteine ligase [Myxococcota bacterium]